MNKESKQLIKEIKSLNANIKNLAKVISVDIGKEELFKGKETKEEKIEVLDKIGLPRRLIAIIVSSTPESVSAIKSMLKDSRTKKGDKQKS